jgi:nucleoside-diphosphate-sugar epimerase
MKILVTGSTGFIGEHLVNALLSQENVEIICPVRDLRKIPYRWRKKVKVIIGDITNINFLSQIIKDIDVVYHLAAISEVSKRILKEDYYKVNYYATINLALKCIKENVRKFVYFSSIEAMGGIRAAVREKRILDEKFKHKPTTIYGESKQKAEKALLSLYKKQGFPVSIVRPTVVYGPGMRTHHGPLKLIKAIDRGFFLFVGSGNNLVSWTYVENVVHGAILVADSEKSNGQIYILSDEEPYPFRQIVRLICKYLDRKIPIVKIPYWIVKTLSAPIELMYDLIGKDPPLSGNKLMYIAKTYQFDVCKLKREFGYSNKVGLEEGVRRTVEWYKEEIRGV